MCGYSVGFPTWEVAEQAELDLISFVGLYLALSIARQTSIRQLVMQPISLILINVNFLRVPRPDSCGPSDPKGSRLDKDTTMMPVRKPGSLDTPE
jgi:hypothetical protein